ncbi:class I SAM-dependent rRNA methyltransferase [Carnobacteriaceae bacterium zg-ZUI78]|nr:class I SAM-dependent rRNA methyltransferase [Carnobacteriaceae bacterium zg-ZUI78]
MEKAYITRQSAQKIKRGNPLLVEKDFSSISFAEGKVVALYDERQQFVAQALLGKQNKGIGFVFSQNPKETLSASFFENLLYKVYQRKQSLVISSTAYRLYNGEADGLGGFTIDMYEGVAVFSWYTQAIYAYADIIIEVFLKVVTECQSVYEKLRYENPPFVSRFVTGQPIERLVIEENGVKFATYMDDGLMTGIFLDQREVRAYLKEKCRGKSVLNTFSYTGAFSVAAAVGGASQTTSVDVAKRSIEKTTEQFDVNGLSMDSQKLYVMDVFDYFKYAKKKELVFDWVVLDPPSFARTKKRTFSVAKNYTELLEDAIHITSKHGHIVASTNASNVSYTDFVVMIDKAFKRLKRAYTIEKVFRLPEDFTTLKQVELSNYLKVIILKVD